MRSAVLVEHPENFMRLALEQAKAAAARNEVPVGAVIVCGGQVVASAHNLVETNTDATEHAEMIVLRAAASAKRNWRLNDASLFVTLEPCPMCIGAILLARVAEVFFGCYDPQQGACGSVFDLSQHAGLPNRATVYPQLLESECREILTDFFEAKRIGG